MKIEEFAQIVYEKVERESKAKREAEMRSQQRAARAWNKGIKKIEKILPIDDLWVCLGDDKLLAQMPRPGEEYIFYAALPAVSLASVKFGIIVVTLVYKIPPRRDDADGYFDVVSFHARGHDYRTPEEAFLAVYNELK